MRKVLNLYLVSLLLCLSCTAVDNTGFIKQVWSKKLIDKCVQSTLVLVGSTDKTDWMGSGVVINKDGLVLTAAHVVSDAGMKTLRMLTLDNNVYDVKVIAINTTLDLALVQPVKSTHKFKFAKVQKSNDVYVGESLIVVGHPLFHYWSVTDGIIMSLPWIDHYHNRMIETNASIHPGSSGGPVYTDKGEVVGIVSAEYVNGLGIPSGIGIVVPIDAIHKILKVYEALPKVYQGRKYRLGDIQ